MATDGVPSSVDDAGGAGEASHVVEADHLAKFDGGGIERVGEGIGGGDLTLISADEVSGGVVVAACVGVGGGFVVELGECGEDATVAKGEPMRLLL